MQEYIDWFQIYLIDTKAWGAIFFIGVGIMFIIGAIKDWNWLFGDVSPVTYNLSKLDGIINLFGRKTGRIISGIGGFILILIGIGWGILCFYKAALINE